MEAREEDNANEKRAVIEIAEITLKEIKIYADGENVDFGNFLQKILQTKVRGVK